MIVVLLLVGIVVLIVGAELLVRGASRLANWFGISPLIVGLTVVSFGTSAPEMAVSVASTLRGQVDIAVGGVVGSNIFNVLLILGLSALIIPLKVHQKLVRFDVPIMVAVACLVYWLTRDSYISRIEGGCLFVGLLAYTGWCIRLGQKESANRSSEQSLPSETHSEKLSEEGTGVEESQTSSWFVVRQLAYVLVGLVFLVVGANLLVKGASDLARMFGVSELIIGLTIVAAGTSFPELATSVVAAIRGERDIAVGNVVGSNLFNMLGVLGLSALVSSTGVPVASQALNFDIPVMVASCIACLPIFFTGYSIARWEGGLLLFYYLAYTVSLVMFSTNHESLPTFKYAMLGYILPLTAMTLVIVTFRYLRTENVETSSQP